jgi:hypothetical protein
MVQTYIENKTELMSLVNREALEPLNENQIEIFKGVISDQSLDSYQTRMHPTTLQRYADTVNNGTPLMLGHDEFTLPVGRLFKGTFDGNSVESYYYIQRGLELNGQKTDDLIGAIKGGTIKDLSVGFRLGEGASINCSICDANIMNDEYCKHRMGRSYDSQKAFLWIKNAGLREVSLVYLGSNTNSKTSSVIRLTRSDDSIIRLEDLNKVAINWSKLASDYKLDFSDLDDGARFELILGTVEPIIREVETLRAQVQGFEALKALAEDGKTYRANLIAEAKAAKIRAFGEIDVKDYEKVLAVAPIEFLRQEIKLYDEMAKKVFGDGKRPTTQIKERANSEGYNSVQLESVYRV